MLNLNKHIKMKSS